MRRPIIVVVLCACAIATTLLWPSEGRSEAQRTVRPSRSSSSAQLNTVVASATAPPSSVVPGRTVVAGPPVFAARSPAEWQGMLVDTTDPQICKQSSHCGLALACQDGHCGPCGGSKCSDNEACVLDHCLLRSNVSCSSKNDCADGELCQLSGLSTDPRGNLDMKSYCSTGNGGDAAEATERRVIGHRTEPADNAQNRTQKRVNELLQ